MKLQVGKIYRVKQYGQDVIFNYKIVYFDDKELSDFRYLGFNESDRRHSLWFSSDGKANRGPLTQVISEHRPTQEITLDSVLATYECLIGKEPTISFSTDGVGPQPSLTNLTGKWSRVTIRLEQ